MRRRTNAFNSEGQPHAGVGFRANRRLKLEVGYLWQYERQRIGPNESNHVLRMQFLIDSKGVHPPHGGS
jgi:hypothetical protein